MPCTLVTAPTEIQCDEVYNFALDQGHTMLVNNTECVTLGHGFTEDVVRHAYYGSERIIEDLRQLDREQNNCGVVELDEQALLRHGQMGRVRGIRTAVDDQQQQRAVVH